MTTTELYHPKILRFGPHGDAYFFAELFGRALREEPARDFSKGILRKTIEEKFGINNDTGEPLRRIFCQLDGKQWEDETYITYFKEVGERLTRSLEASDQGNHREINWIFRDLEGHARGQAQFLLREGVAYDLFEGAGDGYRPSGSEVDREVVRQHPLKQQAAKDLVNEVLNL